MEPEVPMVPDDPVRLTELTSCGGCAAKWGAALLGELSLAARPTGGDGLLVGLAPSDDAAVVRLTDQVALVSTTDFFPPLVDDPADFGAIAAANACSDIFAMGADVSSPSTSPLSPRRCRPGRSRPSSGLRPRWSPRPGASSPAVTPSGPRSHLRPGGAGGGRAGREFVKAGARAGDRLVLSKPLGTGLALASGDPQIIETATAIMRQLNRAAAAACAGTADAVHAVTDVTGFGLLGHGWEMAERSAARLVFDGARCPSSTACGTLPSPACAPEATSATATMSPATSRSRPARPPPRWPSTRRPPEDCWRRSTRPSSGAAPAGSPIGGTGARRSPRR